MKTAQATKYYEDLNGRIACTKHIGCSGEAALANNPNAKVFNTDLTRWERMTAREVFDFAKLVGSLDGVCESCRYANSHV